MGKHFSSLNFRHSIFITHHSFFHTHLATSLLFLSLNFFTLFMDPTPVSRYSVFFFFLVPNSPKLILYIKKKTEPPTQEKKRKEKKKHKQPTPTQEKKKKKKKHSQRQPRKKKKKKSGQKLRLWVPYVCLITILPLSYELWKQSYCLPNKLFVMGPTIF